MMLPLAEISYAQEQVIDAKLQKSSIEDVIRSLGGHNVLPSIGLLELDLNE